MSIKKMIWELSLEKKIDLSETALELLGKGTINFVIDVMKKADSLSKNNGHQLVKGEDMEIVLEVVAQ